MGLQSCLLILYPKCIMPYSHLKILLDEFELLFGTINLLEKLSVFRFNLPVTLLEGYHVIKTYNYR